jgi:hypothetical protein
MGNDQNCYSYNRSSSSKDFFGFMEPGSYLSHLQELVTGHNLQLTESEYHSYNNLT